MKLEKTLFYILVSELLFTVLPVLIVMIVRSYESKYELIFYNTEWSIMAIILYGIIIFGLIPSIIILVINLLDPGLHFGTYLTQIILFTVSVFCYFLIGYLGQKMLEEK